MHFNRRSQGGRRLALRHVHRGRANQPPKHADALAKEVPIARLINHDHRQQCGSRSKFLAKIQRRFQFTDPASLSGISMFLLHLSVRSGLRSPGVGPGDRRLATGRSYRAVGTMAILKQLDSETSTTPYVCASNQNAKDSSIESALGNL
jgi:hypothetical protein